MKKNLWRKSRSGEEEEEGKTNKQTETKKLKIAGVKNGATIFFVLGKHACYELREGARVCVCLSVSLSRSLSLSPLSV